MYKNKIAENLKKLMDAEIITQTELAKKLHLQQPTIGRILSGEIGNPKLNQIIPLCLHYNVSLDELVGLEEIKEWNRTQSNKKYSSIIKQNISTAIDSLSDENAKTLELIMDGLLSSQKDK